MNKINPSVIKAKVSRKEYLKILKNIKGGWFTQKDVKDYEKTREEIENRLKKYSW